LRSGQMEKSEGQTGVFLHFLPPGDQS
jgi:hypothetical protein